MLRNIINPLCSVSHTSDTPPIRVKDSHGLITKHCMIYSILCWTTSDLKICVKGLAFEGN